MNNWSNKLFLEANKANFETTCVSLWFPCLAYGFNKQKLDTLDNNISPQWCGPAVAYCGSNILGVFMCLLYSPFVLNGAHVPPEMVQNIIGLGGSLGTACYAGHFRKRLREKYSIEGNLRGDICTHFLCSPCALCQETLEIESQNVPVSFSTTFDDNSDKVPYIQLMT